MFSNLHHYCYSETYHIQDQEEEEEEGDVDPQ